MKEILFSAKETKHHRRYVTLFLILDFFFLLKSTCLLVDITFNLCSPFQFSFRVSSLDLMCNLFLVFKTLTQAIYHV